MSAQGQTVELDLSSVLQEGTRQFTRLYEENAYRVYNLALRVTCEAGRASEVTARAFLGASLSADSEEKLAAVTLQQSMAGARADPRTGGAGAADAESLLRITAGMAPASRAILALGEIYELTTTEMAPLLGLDKRMVVRLRGRALQDLGAALQATPEMAAALYSEWLWAAPPDSLWEAIFASFYSRLEEEGRRSEHDAEGKAAAVSGGGARRGRLLVRRVRAIPAWLSLGFLPLAAIGAGVALYGLPALTDEEGGGASPPSPPGSEGAGAGAADSQGLSPERLDELRRRELSRLRRFGQQQLRRERDGSRSGDKAASRRERLERRRRQARRREAARVRERRRERAEQSPSPSEPRPRPREAPTRQQPEQQQPERQPPQAQPPPQDEDGAPPSPEEAEQECLFDPDNGTYVCPQ